MSSTLRLRVLPLVGFTCAALLTACGGGGGSSSSSSTVTTTSPAVSNTTTSDPDCPANYKSITLSNTSAPGATLSLSAGNATLSFKTPTDKPTPSVKVCFGVATHPIVAGDLYLLSDTYEILTYDLNNSGAQLSDFSQRRLLIRYNIDKFPAGTSNADMASKSNIYTDAEGPLAMIAPLKVNAILGAEATLGIEPSLNGRYVAAYKP